MHLAMISFSVDGVNVSADHAGGRGAAFLVFAGFLLSFAFIRTSTRLIRMEVPWWPGNLETKSGVHIHHLFWGILLIIVTGFVSYVGDLGSPWWQISAALFGVGVGLTLDEYALFLHLDDVYWADEGRSSIDAAVIALLIAGLVVLGARPFTVDPGGDMWLTVVYTVVDLGFALVTFAKKRLFLGVLALFAPAIGIWCACRIAKPNSYWAHRFYTDDTERGRGKLVKARERFPPDRWTRRLGTRLRDAIGGAPTQLEPPG
jgi:hypothetical protein